MTPYDDQRITAELERRFAAVEPFIPDPPVWQPPVASEAATPGVVRLGPALRGIGSTRGRRHRLLMIAAALGALLIVVWTVLMAGSRLPRTPDLSTGPFGLLRGSDSTASAAVLPNGRVLIVTGTWQGFGATAVPTATIWDPATGTARGLASPLSARVNPTATLLLDGRVLVVGGFGGPYAYSATAVATAEVWDPETEAFTPTGTMAVARVGHTATLLTDGRVLVVGGAGRGNDATSAEVWDPATGRFAEAGTLTDGRGGHTATLLTDGKVLVHGGVGSDGASVGRYQTWDPATSTFDAGGLWVDRTTSATVTRLDDGRLLLVGGITQGGASSGAVWDMAFLRGPAWSPTEAITTLGMGRFNHAAVRLPDGRVLVLGGMTDATTSTASVEVFDPATSSFTPAAPLPRPIADPTAMLLADGRVLVIDDRGPDPPMLHVYGPVSR
jgi:hypothetical protein